MYGDEIKPIAGRVVNLYAAIKEVGADLEVFEIEGLFLNSRLVALDFCLFSQNGHLAKSNPPRSIENENGANERDQSGPHGRGTNLIRVTPQGVANVHFFSAHNHDEAVT